MPNSIELSNRLLSLSDIGSVDSLVILSVEAAALEVVIMALALIAVKSTTDM